MHILLVNYEYPPVGGGAATATAAMARELVRLGHKAVVLTGSYKGAAARVDESGVLVRRVASRRGAADRSNIVEMFSFLLSGLACAPGVAREYGIDTAIVFFSLPCGPIGLLLRRLCGIRYVVSLRGGDVPGAESSLEWLHTLLTPIRRLILRSSVAVVTNSTALKSLAERADDMPVHVIPNGVDAGFFSPEERSEPESEGPFRIAFVGRLRQQKNVSFLLERLTSFAPGEIRLQIIGDGPDRRSLEGYAQRHGINNAITWHGWLGAKELRNVYRNVDCLVNVSLYEGMSNAILEAMACELPVIASRGTGSDAAVEHGVTGLLFDLGQPADFIVALKRLQQDRPFACQLGKAARARVLSKFSWSSVAKEYLDLLTSGAEGPANGTAEDGGHPDGGTAGQHGGSFFRKAHRVGVTSTLS